MPASDPPWTASLGAGNLNGPDQLRLKGAVLIWQKMVAYNSIY